MNKENLSKASLDALKGISISLSSDLGRNYTKIEDSAEYNLVSILFNSRNDFSTVEVDQKTEIGMIWNVIKADSFLLLNLKERLLCIDEDTSYGKSSLMSFNEEQMRYIGWCNTKR